MKPPDGQQHDDAESRFDDFRQRWVAAVRGGPRPSWREYRLPDGHPLRREHDRDLVVLDLTRRLETEPPPLVTGYCTPREGLFDIDDVRAFILAEFRWCWEHNRANATKAEYSRCYPDHEVFIASGLTPAWNCPNPGCGEEVVETGTDAEAMTELECPFCHFTVSRRNLIPAGTGGHFNPGQRIGRYRVVETLGRGEFGVVYRCQDDKLDRPVAVKVPLGTLVQRTEDIAAYLAEARAVASLKHGHIVPVHDVGTTDDGMPFIVYELIPGGSLARATRAGRLPFAAAAAHVADVGDALQHAHTRQKAIFHRDVKPANILLDETGKAYLTDFGLAMREEDFGREAGRDTGTPAYMSPEQAGRRGHAVDGRTDIFSLGVVLYELLAGRLPFIGTEEEVRQRIAETEARPPRQIDPSIPVELERICLKALARRLSDRYTTAGDFATDLRHFLAQQAARPAVQPPTAFDLHPSPANAGAGRGDEPVAVVAKGLASFDEYDKAFFLELLPGPRDRHGVAECLRFWEARVGERRPERTFGVGLMYGPSGCGKTSLVRAGLLPRLPEHVEVVYLEATAGETEPTLLHRLRRLCPDLGPELPLAEMVAAVRRGRGIPQGSKLLIVLDQFEQWLHARPQAEHGHLVRALQQCDGERTQCVLMVRDDFLHAVKRFSRDIGEVDLLSDRCGREVELFHHRHACEVLTKFGRSYGCLRGTIDPAQEAFIDQAVRELSQDGRVTPVRLALFAQMLQDKPWTPDSLSRVGIEGVRIAFLEEHFGDGNRRNRPHQKAIRAVLQALLPEVGSDLKGNMRSWDDLLGASGYAGRRDLFDEVIRLLARELRLIEPTDPGGDGGDAGGRERFFQLTHDYLVPSLREWLTRKQKETRRGRWELRLAKRAAAWKNNPESRELPSWWEWVGIRAFTRKRLWRDHPERAMMRAATRRHLRGFGVWLAAAAVIIACAALWYRAVTGEPRSEAMTEACAPEPWPLPGEVEVVEGRPPPQDFAGFEVLATSRYWDLTRWQPVPVEEIKTRPVQPAISTTVTTLRKLEDSDRTRHLRLYYRTGGYGVSPRARLITAANQEARYRVRKYQYPEEMPGDLGGKRTQLVTVWEMTVDLAGVGADGHPFRVVDHAVWWNGLQDQTRGERSDWVAARFDHQVGSADLAIRLPQSKRLTSWGVSDFPSGGRQPFPSAQAHGTYVNHDSGLIYWRMHRPEVNRVYRIDWMWADR